MAEPDWTVLLPVPKGAEPKRRGEVQVVRNDARRVWRRSVPVLARSAGLSVVDEVVLVDYCVCVARLRECERHISLEGLVVPGANDLRVKSPWAGAANQYRQQLKAYVGELGLSPSSRGRIDAPAAPAGSDDADLCL